MLSFCNDKCKQILRFLVRIRVGLLAGVGKIPLHRNLKSLSPYQRKSEKELSLLEEQKEMLLKQSLLMKFTKRLSSSLFCASCTYLYGGRTSTGNHYPINPHIGYTWRDFGRNPNASFA